MGNCHFVVILFVSHVLILFNATLELAWYKDQSLFRSGSEVAWSQIILSTSVSYVCSY